MQIGLTAKMEAFSIASNAGYDYVELSGKWIAALDDSGWQTLKTALKTSELPCIALNAYCPESVVIAGPGFDLRGAVVYARGLARRAAALGVQTVSVGSPFSRRLPDGFDRTLALDQACHFFDVTSQIFGLYGISTCVEALGECYCNFINTLEEAVDVIRRVGNPDLKLVADFYNMERAGEGDLGLAPYLSWIEHVHLSDDAGSPWKRDFLKPEKCSVVQERLHRLYQAGYRKSLTVEIDLPVTEARARETLELILEGIY